MGINNVCLSNILYLNKHKISKSKAKVCENFMRNLRPETVTQEEQKMKIYIKKPQKSSFVD